MNETPSKAPNCLKCIHYAVSWDPSFPHACKIFEIKSYSLPSINVYKANNAHCPAFEQKEGLK